MNNKMTAAMAVSAGAPANSSTKRSVEALLVGSRIDGMHGSIRLWGWVALIALGAFFEIYDLALTGPISPGLVAAGVFKVGHAGIFGLSDQATFIASTFLGLYLGVIGFAHFGDRVGRKAAFGYALLSYAIATFVMGLQSSPVTVCLWRFLAGIGLGAESVAIDCFLVEIMPKHLRGRAFGVANAIGFSAIPIAALLAALLIPLAPFGVSGWRFLTVLPALGAIAFWVFRRKLPESPRWLASKGRWEEAHAVLDAFEGGQQPKSRQSSEPRGKAEQAGAQKVAPNYVRRAMLMMSIYFVFQTIAFYGFSNWIPTLLEAQGVPLKHSLIYTFGVSLAAPLGPIAIALSADRFERKHQIVVLGLLAIVLGLSFGYSHSAFAWVASGIGLTFANAALSFHSHAYQSEIFPTSIRAKTVGVVYSFTRLAAAASGYIVAVALAHGGVLSVFGTISACMIIALVSIGFWGPRTRNRTFEEITGQP